MIKAPMGRKERSVYNLERTIIARHFGGLAPRRIALVEASDFDGRAREPFLEINRRVIEAPQHPLEIENLLKHLLIHYELRDGRNAYPNGHGERFAARAKELGIYPDCLYRRCFSIDDWLNDASLRSGRNSVHVRVIDAVFGLTDAYHDELLDYFLNQRWEKPGCRIPESLMPWVKCYAPDLANLLCVVASSTKLTPDAV